jgi:[acyl-carrier-protein] S-malonyltransferase
MDVSVMTPRFLNIGGRFSDLERVEGEAPQRRWRTVRLLNYPAHSRYILPYVAQARADVSEVRVAPAQLPIFSSLSCRPLVKESDIRDEIVLNMTQTIRWNDSVQTLIRDHGVTRFINLGPCQSLPKMMRDLSQEVPMLDATELLGV